MLPLSETQRGRKHFYSFPIVAFVLGIGVQYLMKVNCNYAFETQTKTAGHDVH